jgi:hypothetical protein
MPLITTRSITLPPVVSVLTIVVTVLSVAGALAVNHWYWRPRQARDRSRNEGMTTHEIAVPLVTLAVVLLVFVLVQVFSSWTSAGRAETDEATSTLLLFREGELLDDVQVRGRVRADVVCYATSVVEQDWPAMADGRISNVPTYWGDRLREAGVQQARSSANPDNGTDLVARDGERAAARQRRLAEARPSVPDALNLLMLAAVAGTLVVLGVASAGVVRPGVHAGIVVLSGVIFGATLLLIRDFDQPYRGLTGRAPEQTRFVRDLMAAELRQPLPCRGDGLPRDDPAFRVATGALR